MARLETVTIGETETYVVEAHWIGLVTVTDLEEEETMFFYPNEVDEVIELMDAAKEIANEAE